MKSKKLIITILIVALCSTMIIFVGASKVINSEPESHDYSEDTEFYYSLADKYDRLKSVNDELKKLNDAFEFFCDNKTDEECFKNLSKYENYKSILNNYLLDFEKDENDVLSEKEEKLYYAFDLIDDEMSFIFERYSNSKDKDNLKEKYDSIKKDYEKGKEVIKEYESGHISIDEALNSFEITIEEPKPEDCSNSTD